MVPPEDKQKDAGQFNAWLTNLAPKPPARPAAPGQAPAAPRAPIGKPAGMPSAGGLLGAGLDDELDDIFGKIVTDDGPAPTAPPPQAPAMPKPAPPPPPQQMAPRPPAPPAASAPQPPARMPIQEAPAPPPPQQTAPRPAAPPAINIPQPPPLQPAVPAGPAALQSTYKQIEAAVNEVRQEMQDQIDQLELKHHSEIQGAVARTRSEMQAQIQQMQAQRQNDVQNAMAQGRVEVQAKIQDIQLKYQDQRQKWEKVLKDLRDRNEELTVRNHELEEQMSQLRERQRMLIQEYAGMNAPQAQPPAQMAPIQIDEPGGLEIVFPGEMSQPETGIPEIKIELPESIAGEQESAEADQAIRTRNENTLSEADDLLAELDALENDMKNLGEDN